MKYLDSEPLMLVSGKIEENVIDCVLDFRLELYSCKMVSMDKRLYKGFIGAQAEESRRNNCQALSPSPPPDELWDAKPASKSSADEEGAQCFQAVSNKTLFYLIETLNSSFPDYAFFNATGISFTRTTYEACVQDVNSRFTVIVSNFNTLKGEMWSTIASAIDSPRCEIYSYIPSPHGDPYSEPGCAWSFNYIFFNRQLNRTMFMSCRTITSFDNTAGNEYDDEDYQWSMDD